MRKSSTRCASSECRSCRRFRRRRSACRRALAESSAARDRRAATRPETRRTARDRRSPDLPARIPAGLPREVEPERTCRSRDRSASPRPRAPSAIERTSVSASGDRLEKPAWHRSIASLRSPRGTRHALVYALHQDFWFWRTARPLVFGFLPVGLFYHAAYTSAISLLDVAPRPARTGRRTSRA